MGLQYLCGGTIGILPWGPLHLRASSDDMSSSVVSSAAKIMDICNGHAWVWPRNELFWTAVSYAIPSSLVPHPDRADLATWRHNPTGLFSIKTAYEVMRDKRPEVPWHQLVWGKGCVPKHSFILWLAIRNRLVTKDKLLAMELLQNMVL
ncbi:hypothetical protein CJ030_MR5G009703 [Morella rubra]|uniref:Reverse transcriptase zinc-binding domain-containing protein n=1 Tax=Morella rubra TaxID=262757 RepID=A0A6A1VIM7_9ROSI|nr:hypothetical protein CJ030_MR5G009703 [Morella rubra]